MDVEALKEQIRVVASKRETLVDLLEKPDLGTLRLDVNQAIEELDDLLDEFHELFPEEKSR